MWFICCIVFFWVKNLFDGGLGVMVNKEEIEEVKIDVLIYYCKWFRIRFKKSVI